MEEKDIIPGNFYWLEYLGEVGVGMALDYYGEIRFRITGWSELIEFSRVKKLAPVCVFVHTTPYNHIYPRVRG